MDSSEKYSQKKKPFILLYHWLKENINTIKSIFNKLNQNYEVEYLLAIRFTQYCIECLFSV